MAETKETICNKALLRIGITVEISDFDSDTIPEARACRALYDNVLERSLADVDWGFARRRLELTESSDDAVDPWSYIYDYPASCVRVLRIDDELAVRLPERRIRFVTLTNGSGERRILTNQEDAWIYYTHLDTTPANYPAHFLDYLAWALADELAMPLSASDAKAKNATQMREFKRAQSIRQELESEEEDDEIDASWIEARG